MGILNFIIDMGLLFILVHGGLPEPVANTISTTIAFVFSFFMNRSFTFKANGGSLPKQMFLFTVITLFGLWVLQNLVIWLTLPLIHSILSWFIGAGWFGWLSALGGFGKGLVGWIGSRAPGGGNLFVAKCVATVVSMIWNYILYARIVFKQKPAPEAEIIY